MRINFNIDGVQPYSGANPILPEGEYVVEIVDEKEQPLKTGNGVALVFDYQIKAGQYRGVRIRDWLNLNHASEQAREIGQRRLKAISQSVGVERFVDTRELFNRPFVIVVSQSEYQGKIRNSIDEYKPAHVGGSSFLPTPQPATNAEPAPASAPVPQTENQPMANANAAPFWS